MGVMASAMYQAPTSDPTPSSLFILTATPQVVTLYLHSDGRYFSPVT